MTTSARKEKKKKPAKRTSGGRSSRAPTTVKERRGKGPPVFSMIASKDRVVSLLGKGKGNVKKPPLTPRGEKRKGKEGESGGGVRFTPRWPYSIIGKEGKFWGGSFT